ncbi:MAG: hypothetical protein L0Y39_10045, partial [Methylococcaceae bacterium]|nr:hypothetical protein [Methylococcaceae bacterium]
GDGLCLQCLGRINPTRVAAEEQAGRHLGNELVTRGYTRGCDVKEPAVKTLNAVGCPRRWLVPDGPSRYTWRPSGCGLNFSTRLWKC